MNAYYGLFEKLKKKDGKTTEHALVYGGDYKDLQHRKKIYSLQGAKGLEIKKARRSL